MRLANLLGIRFALTFLATFFVVGIFLWFLSSPSPLDSDDITALPAGDATLGERVFVAAGCGSCHSSRSDDTSSPGTLLGGGESFVTPFGTFFAPNISPDSEFGIGSWSRYDFANALLRGVTPDGSHYYPAFPYTSYARMNPRDVINLWAYLNTLPPVSSESIPHSLSFPFNIRRGLGLWKLLYLDSSPVLFVEGDDILRGQYIVEALSHCGECHTPRDIFGGLRTSHWLSGARSPDNKEFVPNITPHMDGIGDWSVEQIAESLHSGFKPDYDTFGSTMVDVQENLSRLTPSDRLAIAAYLKSVESLPSSRSSSSR